MQRRNVVAQAVGRVFDAAVGVSQRVVRHEDSQAGRQAGAECPQARELRFPDLPAGAEAELLIAAVDPDEPDVADAPGEGIVVSLDAVAGLPRGKGLLEYAGEFGVAGVVVVVPRHREPLRQRWVGHAQPLGGVGEFPLQRQHGGVAAEDDRIRRGFADLGHHRFDAGVRMAEAPAAPEEFDVEPTDEFPAEHVARPPTAQHPGEVNIAVVHQIQSHATKIGNVRPASPMVPHDPLRFRR